MKYFLDTEFSERGPKFPVELISIGIVAEDGREFYAVSREFNKDACNDWVKESVLPKIFIPDRGLHIFGDTSHPLETIKRYVRMFIDPDPKPQFIGYYSAYDWVVFCQIFGTMMDLPKGWPMYCRDLKQLCDDKGNPKLPETGKGEHNALSDAHYNKLAYEFLESYTPDRRQLA